MAAVCVLFRGQWKKESVLERHLRTFIKNAVSKKKGKFRLYLAGVFWRRATFCLHGLSAQALAVL